MTDTKNIPYNCSFSLSITILLFIAKMCLRCHWTYGMQFTRLGNIGLAFQLNVKKYPNDNLKPTPSFKCAYRCIFDKDIKLAWFLYWINHQCGSTKAKRVDWRETLPSLVCRCVWFSLWHFFFFAYQFAHAALLSNALCTFMVNAQLACLTAKSVFSICPCWRHSNSLITDINSFHAFTKWPGLKTKKGANFIELHKLSTLITTVQNPFDSGFIQVGNFLHAFCFSTMKTETWHRRFFWKK